MRRQTFLAIALLTAACGPSNKQTVTKTETPTETAQPAPDVEYPKIAIPYEKFVLDNGLTVLVHEDHKVPVVAVNVWYHVGSKDERPGKTGFAHLFEHLMFQGSENYKGEFFEPLEKAGATDMNGTTNKDRTNYFETVPVSALDTALWMESDRMGHFKGAISKELLDEQRGVVQNEKRQGQNRPYGKAWEMIPPNTYPVGHPYSWTVIGSMEDLNAASLEDVKEWFTEYYGASNAVVALAGDITVAEAKRAVEKYFGDIPSGPAVPRRGTWVAKMTERKEMTTYDRVPQERVYRVYNLPPYGERTTEEVRVAGWLLGEGKNSRLYKRLVYEDQLATSVAVWLSEGEIGSQLMIIADARPGVPLAKVEAAMEEEIARLAEEAPTHEELVRVKMSKIAEQVSRLERVGGFGGKSDVLARHEVYVGDAGAFDRILGYVKEATPETVRAATANWLGDGVFVLRVLPEPLRSTTAAQADRSKVPMPGQAPALELPPIQRAKLSNGIEVLLVERHDTPLVKVHALFDVGFSYDQKAKPGTTKFAMDVLDEGTESMSSLELAATLDRLGASLSNSVSLDDVTLGLTTLTTTVGESLDVFADILRNPAFSAEEIERVRKQTLAAIEQEKAQPFTSALRLLGPILFTDDHPYGLPLTGTGTTDAVTSLTREDLLQFHGSVLHPERATLLVVGDTTMPEIQKQLEERFGSWKPATKAVEPPKAKAERGEGVTVYLIDKPKAEQSVVIAGHVIAPRDKETHIALDAMNSILGGTFTSRINMNLREDKHWSYGARSFVFETQLDQVFGAYAAVQTDKTAESMVEMQKELSEFLGTRPATADELQKIKENKTRRLPGQNETSDRLLSSVTEIVRFGLPDDYWNTYVGRIDALALPDIESAAKSTLDPGRLTWIVVGDLEKVEPKIRALNLGKVVEVPADGAR